VFTSDFFYHPRQDLLDLLQRFGFLALDMETAGLYGIAAEFGAEALSVMTVSDHLADDAHMDAEQRETGVDRMVRLVLDSLLP
jgi:purine-nucleoside phosphorylase